MPYTYGYMGKGKYKSRINGIQPKSYKTWLEMLRRCYCPKSLEKNPTYKDCKVCDEWHNYQNFAKWFDETYIEGHHLDKDIKGNGKLYSPSTCTWVTQADNNKANAKTWNFITPTGDEIEITNLKQFCKDNNLDDSTMAKVHKGTKPQHKGYYKA